MNRPENTIFLIGRLTSDPEIKTTSTGIEFCNFTLAIDRGGKGEEKQTDFIDCTAWRQSVAFITNYFSKGRKMVVLGELQTRTYEDNDGKKRKAYTVSVSSVTFADSKSNNTESGSGSKDFAEDTAPSEMPVSEEDLPF